MFLWIGLSTLCSIFSKTIFVAGLSSMGVSKENMHTTVDFSKIQAISLDVTGTLVATKEPVVKSYRDAALWAKLPVIPSHEDFKTGFTIAFRQRCIQSPCFGGVEGISGREWWRATVKAVLDQALISTVHSQELQVQDQPILRNESLMYTEDDFQRYFRRVYQHFGSPAGYMVLDDARSFLSTIKKSPSSNQGPILGITSNTPTRHMDSVLPMLDCLHDRFDWFTCSQDVGHEKPSPQIFEDAFRQARYWIPTLEKENVLHIGDSYTNDYCGAKAYGFQALFLDRTDHTLVTQYQDWLEAPEYPGKSLEDVESNTIKTLEDVTGFLLQRSSI